MGDDSTLDLLVVSDIHNKLLPINPRLTIENIVSDSEADFFVNLGDNSGEYARNVANLAEEYGFPHVSVLGNHDIQELEVGAFSLRKQKAFYSQEITLSEQGRIRKAGYGVFGKNSSYITTLSDFRMYYMLVECQNSNIGIIFRHFPFNTDRASDMRYALELINNDSLNCLYVVSGHRHTKNLAIEGRQKEIKLNSEKIPIFTVLIPPFTRGVLDPEGIPSYRQLQFTRSHVKFFAGLYELSVLDSGALRIKERYFKNGAVKTKPLSIVAESSLPKLTETEIITGDLLVALT